MAVREEIAEQLDVLSEDELEQVAQYLAFLKYRSRIAASQKLDENQLASPYARFLKEDCEVAFVQE